MNLNEKLESIGKTEIKGYSYGYCGTIEDVWSGFIETNLPTEEVVLAWYRLLIDYCEEKDAVFAIRTFGSWGPDKDPRVLRRGFYNKTNSDYSFFYTDNYFAAYFAKMALDGYVPTLDEFKKAMINRSFPARFGPCDSKFEKHKAAYNITFRNPGITNKQHKYKIAHIIDAGKDFYIDGQVYNIGDICKKYFPRGEYDDWKYEEDVYGPLWVRHLDVQPEAKEILKAHFLRFTCPLNYVLTPGVKNHVTEVKIKHNDIAEYDHLQWLLVEKMRDRFGDVYVDYLSRIKIPPLPKKQDWGNEFVGMRYWNDMASQVNVIGHKKFFEAITSPSNNTKKELKTDIYSNKNTEAEITNSQKIECIQGYLINGYSFRRLEKEYLNIDSKSNGGGFVAQKLIKEFGISKEMKGQYTLESLEYYSGDDPVLKRISRYLSSNND